MSLDNLSPSSLERLNERRHFDQRQEIIDPEPNISRWSCALNKISGKFSTFYNATTSIGGKLSYAGSKVYNVTSSRIISTGKKVGDTFSSIYRKRKKNLDNLEKEETKRREKEQEEEIEKLREELGLDCVNFAQTVEELLEISVSHWANQATSEKKEKFLKRFFGNAQKAGLIGPYIDYEQLVLIGLKNFKNVTDKLTLPEIVYLSSSIILEFSKVEKEARSVPCKSQEEKILHMLQKLGRPVPGFPKPETLVGLTPEEFQREMQKSTKEYLKVFSEDLLHVFFPGEIEDFPLWRSGVMEQIGLLKYLHKKGYENLKTNAIIPFMQSFLEEFVVEAFSDPHELNLMILRLAKENVSDLELEGFGLEKKRKVCKLAENFMKECMLGKDPRELQIFFEERSKNLKTAREQNRYGKVKEEAEIRTKTLIAEKISIALLGKAKKARAAKIQAPNQWKTVRKKIRETHVLKWILIAFETSYYLGKFGLTWLYCFHTGAKRKEATKQWFFRKVFGYEWINLLVKTVFENFHKINKRILILQTLEELRSAFQRKSSQNNEEILNEQDVFEESFHFEESSILMGKIGSYVFEAFFPKHLIRFFSNLFSFFKRWNLFHFDLEVKMGEFFVEALKGYSQKNVTTFLHSSLRHSISFLKELSIGFKTLTALKEEKKDSLGNPIEGFENKNLDKIIQIKVSEFIQNYVRKNADANSKEKSIDRLMDIMLLLDQKSLLLILSESVDGKEFSRGGVSFDRFSEIVKFSIQQKIMSGLYQGKSGKGEEFLDRFHHEMDLESLIKNLLDKNIDRSLSEEERKKEGFYKNEFIEGVLYELLLLEPEELIEFISKDLEEEVFFDCYERESNLFERNNVIEEVSSEDEFQECLSEESFPST